ncbi:MAG: murein biosynthesis integral membrane protein MurJ [Salinisphaeraceae bacterium]|nr:murein biosynthesis integral membrane protein MurJ [Salinisphaeraceae bacterium]
MSRSLLRSTGVVSLMTMLSRVLGFVRDVVFAVLFGAAAGMDAFLIAFKIPNFMRRLFAEGAFAQSFVPVFSATRRQGTVEDARELADVVAGTLGGILLGVTVLGVIGAPVLVTIFAPGFLNDAGQFELTVSLLRLTFPYLMFVSLVAFAGGILNSYGQFAVPAFTPVLLNVCLIGAALGLANRFDDPVTALAIGVFVAGAAQLLFQLPWLLKLGLMPRPRWGWANEKVRRIMTLMLPILFGSSVAQVNLMLDTIIASLLATGSVSWLYYSDRLMEFPLGVFSIAIATVILPSLSDRHAAQSGQAFSDTLDWALKLLIVIGTPALVGLFVLAGPLITTLFNYRSFDSHDVIMSQQSLMAYSIGFMSFSLVKVLVPGFFARQDTKTPVRCGIISVLATMAMNLTFVGALVYMQFDAPHVGLALATSLGAFVNAGLLYHYLRRDDVYRPGAGWLPVFLRVGLASLAMGAALYWFAGSVEGWMLMDLQARVQQLLLLIGGGALVYGAVLLASGFRPRHVAMAE